MFGTTQEIERIKTKRRLPGPKGVALAIIEICRRDDATIAEIAKVVQSDPILSARLIRLANSGADTGRPVIAIPDAIIRLGLSAVRMLALGFSLVEQYSRGSCQAFDYPRFWSHSLLMAVACQELGGHIRAGSRDELFACGLLTRIGCLALATIYPVEYGELLAQQDVDADITLLELERERLHVDHNEVTAVILSNCDIPETLVEAVCSHEAPEASGFTEGSRAYQLAHLFYHAKRLADLGLMPARERYSKTSELMLLGGKIGLDADKMGAEVDRIFRQWHVWGELLKVPTSTTPPFAKMAAAPAPQPDGEGASTQLRVLLLGDDTSERSIMENALGRTLGQRVYSTTNAEEALATALELVPQIVVADRLMLDGDGVEFCRALRATEWGQFMYVIMLAHDEVENEIVEAFEAGVNDYVVKPLNIHTLSARMRAALMHVKLLEAWERDRAQLKRFTAELAISSRRLEQISRTHLLTGIPDLSAGMKVLSQAWLASNRSGQPLSVIMVSVDYFKSINGGRAVGDAVLREVASAVQTVIRGNDSICSLGDEKFLLIFPNTNLKSSFHAAERLRTVVRSLKIKDSVGQIVISIGITGKESDMFDASAMLKAAAKALHAAKDSGQDRICLIKQNEIHFPDSELASSFSRMSESGC